MAKQKEPARKEGRRVAVTPLRKGEQQSRGEGFKKWSQLVAQAWADNKLKRRLLSDPISVLSEYGIEVPAGVEIRVVEDTEKVTHLTLPVKPSGAVNQLTAREMKAVLGGAMGAPVGMGRCSSSGGGGGGGTGGDDSNQNPPLTVTTCTVKLV